ncbi:MAG: Mut7-C RNAse domain-containing protein [candidate division WOR-3 bacterium]
MKFLVDQHAGKLCRWLRFLGFDAEMAGGSLYDLAARAIREGRVLLTRNRRAHDLPIVKALVLLSDDPDEQLRQVLSELSLKTKANPFTRCPVCNEELVDVEKEEVKHLVPPHTYSIHEEFSMCPCCGRVYWEGSHVERMRATLEELLGEHE